MSAPQIQPWSVVDDNDDLPQVTDSPGVTDGGAPGAGKSAVKPAPRDVIGPRWALGPLLANIVIECVQLVQAANLHTGLISFLQLGSLSVAAWLLWHGLKAQRRQMSDMLNAANPAERTESPLKLSRDLREFDAALRVHLDRLSEELQRTRDEGMTLGYRLASTEQRHTRAVLDHLGDAVLVVDSAGKLLYVNDTAGTLLNFVSHDAIKHPIADIVPNADLVQHLMQTLKAPLKSRRHADWEYNERKFDLWLTHAPAGLAGETDGGFVAAVLRDVTREKDASRVMSEFISHVSHELRTPLSSLKAYVEMLVTGEANDEQTRKEYFGIIEAETNRMARMIDEILNISRIESGVVKLSREPVSLSLVVREVVDVMKPQAEKKQIKLTDDISPIAHEVLADRDMIKEAILNLTSNAIKYTPDGGQVRVRLQVREKERAAVVDVTDTGLGIPEADLPRMFEKFFRVKANSKIAKGTGLGLNLVKNIVETAHGGKVSVQSKVGSGSTFSVSLPLV